MARLIGPKWITWTAVIAAVVLWFTVALFLSQPCAGDTVCAPTFGLLFVAPFALAHTIGLVIWKAIGRSSVLLLTSVPILLFGGLVLTTLASGATAPIVLPLILGGIAALITIGGCVEELSGHPTERWLTAGLLALVAVSFVFWLPLAAAVPATIVAWIWVIRPRPRESAPDAAP